MVAEKNIRFSARKPIIYGEGLVGERRREFVQFGQSGVRRLSAVAGRGRGGGAPSRRKPGLSSMPTQSRPSRWATSAGRAGAEKRIEYGCRNRIGIISRPNCRSRSGAQPMVLDGMSCAFVLITPALDSAWSRSADPKRSYFRSGCASGCLSRPVIRCHGAAQFRARRRARWCRRGCTARPGPAGRSRNAPRERARSRSTRPSACLRRFEPTPWRQMSYCCGIRRAMKCGALGYCRRPRVCAFAGNRFLDRLGVVEVAGRFWSGGNKYSCELVQRSLQLSGIGLRFAQDIVAAQPPAVVLQCEGRRATGIPTRSFGFSPWGNLPNAVGLHTAEVLCAACLVRPAPFCRQSRSNRRGFSHKVPSGRNTRRTSRKHRDQVVDIEPIIGLEGRARRRQAFAALAEMCKLDEIAAPASCRIGDRSVAAAVRFAHRALSRCTNNLAWPPFSSSGNLRAPAVPAIWVRRPRFGAGRRSRAAPNRAG